MRDVRQHEAPLDHLRRATLQDFSRLSPDQRGDALLGVQADLQHGVDLGGGEIAGGAAVENHVERIERALGLPELIGDDADRVVARQIRQPWMLGARVFVGDGERRELHHRAHAGHFENIGGGAERQLGGGGGKLPVRQPLAKRIDDEAVLGAALRDIDSPPLCRRTGEYLAGGCAGGTQALIERRGRHRGALFLRRWLVPERDLVGRLAGHEPDLDALPIGVELVGENLRQRRVRPLPHLRLREGERDLSAPRDHDPIGDLVALRGAASSYGDGNEERCRRQRSSGEDEAARHGRHHMLRGIG